MQFRVGDIEVLSLVEEEGPLIGPAETFGTEAAAICIERRAELEPWAIDPVTGQLIFKIQSYLVRTPRHTVLIDTCIGCNKSISSFPNWNNRQDRTWLDRLGTAGVAPEEIDYVFCTHLHSDHCGWNTRLRDGRWVPTFPNARYMFSRLEYSAAEERNADSFRESVLPVMEAGQAVIVEMDHAIDDSLWLQTTPGHTVGHYAVTMASNGARASMCGDLIYSPIQCQYPDWYQAIDFDREMARRTRRAYLEERCEAGDLMLPAHFPSPSVGRVLPDGDVFRYVFEG